MNSERLIHLTAVLYAVEQSAVDFDMCRWICKESSGCGTAACALGHAALDPWMQEQGLYLSAGFCRISSVAQYDAWQTHHFGGMVLPSFGTTTGFDAAMDFFGITEAAASYLFDQEWYHGPDAITPADVITRVDEVIRLNGNAPDDAEGCGER